MIVWFSWCGPGFTSGSCSTFHRYSYV